MAWEDKPLKKQGHNAVPQRYNATIDDWEIETTEADPVYDADVLNKLNELDTKVQGIIDGTTPANTQLTGRYLEVKDVNADVTGNSIAAGSAVTIQVKPPVGMIWKTPLIWAVAPSPAGATTGTNRIELKHGIDNYRYLALRASSNFGNMARIMANIAETATESSLPQDRITQQNAIQNLILTNDKPLFVTFYNSTDVVQTGNLELRLIVTEERAI